MPAPSGLFCPARMSRDEPAQALAPGTRVVPQNTLSFRLKGVTPHQHFPPRFLSAATANEDKECAALVPLPAGEG